MASFGFHSSHEQFSPSELLACVQHAERAGFTHAMCSDHFYPWGDRQGQSGFAWSWLGAALQATSLPMGVVTTPGYRYHPAILAQACATLAEMFPHRFWVTMGSGEALNEEIIGHGFPPKSERNARLKECVDIIRALWAGETVTHDGLVKVREARLYTRPLAPPPIIGAAITTETAEWVAGWADGVITVNQTKEKLEKFVEAYQRGGAGDKPMFLQVHLSYAQTEEQARQQAFDQWRTNIFSSSLLAELRLPEHFDAAAEFVKPHDLDDFVRISADPQQHIEWIREYIEMGFSRIYLHNVGPNQREFIEVFGEQVLPALAPSAAARGA